MAAEPHQGVTLRPLAILIPASLILLAVIFVAAVFEVRPGTMTRDIAALAGVHPLAGVLSNLGMLLWCAATTVCFFGAWILRARGSHKDARFLAWSGVLTGYLLLDDLFLLHELLLPDYVGLPEKAVYLAIFIGTGAYAFAFWRDIRQTPYLLLLLAVGFLSVSVSADVILGRFIAEPEYWGPLLEDGPKWIGIAYWCGYYVATARQMIERPDPQRAIEGLSTQRYDKGSGKVSRK